MFSEPVVENQFKSSLGTAATAAPKGGGGSGGRGVSKEGRLRGPAAPPFGKPGSIFAVSATD